MPHLIDGYNLLRLIQKVNEELITLTEAGLCRIISEYLVRVRDYGHIFFDGVGPPDKTNLSNFTYLEVYFSGPNTDADSLIELKIADNTAPKSLVVVSTDRRIKAAAKKRKAISLRSEVFWAAMVTQLERRRPTPEPKEKRQGITDGETDQWLDIFGI